MLQVVTKVTLDGDRLVVELPQSALEAFKRLTASLSGGIAVCTFKKWYRARSTGPHSQNRHINSHIAQIAEATGNDFDTVKTWCKVEAISSGYPFDTLKGLIVPWSETRIDRIQAAILIDTIHRLAAELSIPLREED